MSSLVITVIIVERIAIAVIGLLAAIYDQVWWSVFMGAILMILIASTNIKVKER
jgi:hypothetical protein